MKLSKICFLCAYVDKMIIEQRLMFCSKFSFTIFLLMFFPLCSKVLTNILKIYELPKKIKQYLNIAKHLTEQQSSTRPILCHNFIWLLNYTPINFIENVPLEVKQTFGTKFKKILGRIFFF